ncbi:MAG: hypothetical protein DI556_04810 [Rhodovulum sulfidophilum]|uniref:SHOCT domain-containing protein n=1 Tax=Rhodovulum sulfidophilum TaxID=35806 RepID=A0A2W5NKX4_RHOSU|nr:MAG: hypothetical protein DI556_04810 [Rhodovulum sulfidophilum]
MQTLSDQGQEIARAAAERHGVSVEAAAEMLRALAAGYGNQAQFSHPELGGMGQWSRGGMLMIGDMFNNGLKARVDALATDLSAEVGRVDVLRREAAPGFASSGWPAEFGAPATSGAQNDMRYAFFPAARRLVIARGGVTEIYDSGDNMITGVGQQQGGDQTVSFSTAQGPLSLAALRRIDAAPAAAPEPVKPAAPEPVIPAAAPVAPEPPRAAAPSRPVEPARPAEAPAAAPAPGGGDVLATIEKLADLRDRGILSEEEFAAKKSELLGRL